MNIFGAPFHASYSRASVDALSNFVELPEFSFEGDIHALCRRELDPQRIPLFLHEATHHWCFDTPVFYALFILQFRALGGLCKIADRERAEQWNIIDDIYRFRAVVDLYRPIIEGLALFAEYAAVPSGQFIYSHPFSQVIVLCRAWLEELDEKEGFAAFKRLLMAGRTSDGFVRRKAGLLSMPFDPGRSPYLTGHMLVCSIWRSIVMQRVNQFTNTDAFLSYLRSYFFFDYGLIAILMNNDLHETAILKAVARHLMRRIIRLINPTVSMLLALRDEQREKVTAEDIQKYSINTLNGAVTQWDSDCHNALAITSGRIAMRRKSTWFHKAEISGLDGLFRPTRGVLIDEAKATKTHKQLLAAFEWLLAETNESEGLTVVKENAFRLLSQRPNLTLCRCPVRAIIGNGKCVVTLNTASFIMEAAKDARPGEHEARLELVVSSRITAPLSFVFAEGKLVGAALPPELTDRKIEELGGGLEIQQFVQILKEITEKDVSVADSYVPMLTESYERRISEAVDHVYDTVFMILYGEAILVCGSPPNARAWLARTPECEFRRSAWVG
jgi:hypothetical protein